MLVMKISWTEFEVEVGIICRILKHGRLTIFREKMGMKYPWGFHIITFKERSAHNNIMFYGPKKIPLTN